MTVTNETIENATSNWCPIWFRGNVASARLQRDISTGFQADYATAGWHLGIHLRDLVQMAYAFEGFQDVIRNELDACLDDDEREEKLWAFLRKRFPKMMSLVPSRRRHTFMKGVMFAVEEGRL